MSVLFTAEQLEFRQSLRDFLNEKAGPESRRRRMGSPIERDDALWKDFDQLGVREFFASRDPEAKPGALELGIVARECGRALLSEPLTEALFAGPYFLFQLLSPEAAALVQQHYGADLLRDVEQGKKQVALAGTSFFCPLNVESRGSSPLLRVSTKIELLCGASKADFLLFAAHIGNEEQVLLADLRTGKEQKVSAARVPALDLTIPQYDVELANVAALQIPNLTVPFIRQRLAALLAEEFAGIASVPVEMTLEHVKTRKQFGVPLGSFQAVQHRLADMQLKVEAMSSLATFASWCIDRAPDQVPLAALSALMFAAEQCGLVTEAAIQLHGGIGFTWEYDAHLYLRRAKRLELLFGGTAKRSEELLAAVGLE